MFEIMYWGCKEDAGGGGVGATPTGPGDALYGGHTRPPQAKGGHELAEWVMDTRELPHWVTIIALATPMHACKLAQL